MFLDTHVWHLIWVCCFSMVSSTLAYSQSTTLVHQLIQVSDGQQDASDVLQQLILSSPGNIRLAPGTYRLEKTIEVDLSQTGYFSLEGSPACKLVMIGSPQV